MYSKILSLAFRHVWVEAVFPGLSPTKLKVSELTHLFSKEELFHLCTSYLAPTPHSKSFIDILPSFKIQSNTTSSRKTSLILPA